MDEPTPDEAPETASVPPETQRRASRDLVILYWVMGIFVLLPMVVLLVKFLGQE
ncbi:MAG: hypothetical protein ACFB20_08465 [Opitutales bacterium]